MNKLNDMEMTKIVANSLGDKAIFVACVMDVEKDEYFRVEQLFETFIPSFKLGIPSADIITRIVSIVAKNMPPEYTVPQSDAMCDRITEYMDSFEDTAYVIVVFDLDDIRLRVMTNLDMDSANILLIKCLTGIDSVHTVPMEDMKLV